MQDAGGSPLWCSHMRSCVNRCLWRVPMHDSLEIKTLCGTWLVIRRELKQQAEETTEKKRREERRKEKGERRKGRCLQGAEWLIAFAALPQSLSGLRFYQGVRQTFPAGSLLLAVCTNVIAIGEIWCRRWSREPWGWTLVYGLQRKQSHE